MVFKSSEIINSSIDKDKIKFIVLDFKALSETDKQYIISNFSEMVDGKDTYKNKVHNAKYVLKVLSSKDKKQKYGAIAEFVLICILRHNEFAQAHCFTNLEDRGAKKGFDGLYTDKDDIHWIAESKASYEVKSHNNNHKTTIDRGYTGLKKQLSGAEASNVWQNAYQHARSFGAGPSLIRKLATLSEKYVDGNYSLIEDNSIILGSSVFVDDISIVERDIKSIEQYIANHKAKNELLVIITAKTIDMILDVFKEIANE